MHRFSVLERLLVVAVVITFLFTSCVSCVTHMQRTVYVPDTKEHTQLRTSVARVRLQPGEKGRSSLQATAFAITPDHLLTAGHFCRNAEVSMKKKIASQLVAVEAAGPDGMIYHNGDAKISAISDKHDICLLFSEGHMLDPLPFMTELEVIQSEDKITIIGAPRGYFPVRSDGRVISLYGDESQFGVSEQPLMPLRVDIEPGSSGSPVIWNGYVVGIVVKYIGRLKNGALAVRSDHAVDFVSRHLDVNELKQGE